MTTDSTKIISIDIDIVAIDESIGIRYPNPKNEEYFIVITVTNTQDTTVHFTTMTCSWEESFTFNNDSLFLSNPGCDSNVPTLLEILPHKSVKFFGKLARIGRASDYKNPPSFKIGFVDLPTKFFWESHSRKDKLKYRTYWSENILLRARLYEFENHARY